MIIKSAKYLSVLLNNFLYDMFIDLYDASTNNLTTDNLRIYQATTAVIIDIIHYLNQYSYEDNNYEFEKLKVCEYIEKMKEVAARKYGVNSKEYKGYLAAIDEIKQLYQPDYHIDTKLIEEQIKNLTEIKDKIDTYGVSIMPSSDDGMQNESGDEEDYEE